VGGLASSGLDGAVVLSQMLAVVGDPTSDDFGPAQSGIVRGYGIGGQGGIIDYFPSDLRLNGRFGSSVASSDSYVIGGAPGYDEGGANSGCVFVFEAATGIELRKLVASDRVAGAMFGASLALDGDILAVGAPGGIGAVYVFDLSDASERFKLLPGDSEAGDLFGTALAINEGDVLVGRPTSGGGSAHLFDVASGVELARFDNPNQVDGQGFGRSLAISQKFVLIGVPNDETAILYDRKTRVKLAEMGPSSPFGGTLYGSAVALNGNFGLVGSPSERRNAGTGSPWYLGQVGYYRFRVPSRSAREIFDEVVRQAAPALAVENLEPSAVPFADGVSNLLKYAFNMDLAESDPGQLLPGGITGLPRGGVVEVDGKDRWQFEYLRRIGSGLQYTPERSDSLEEESFQIIVGSEVVEEIPGTGFERVRVIATNEVSSIRTGFYRVRVSMPE